MNEINLYENKEIRSAWDNEKEERLFLSWMLLVY